MRNIVLTIILLLLVAPHAWAQREVYERYAQRDDLFVAYAQGYRLDSLNRIDAILIQAKDSAAWAWMLQEFHIESPKQADLVCNFAKFDDPTQPTGISYENHSCITIVASFKERYMGLFFVETFDQFTIVWDQAMARLSDANH